MTTLMSCSISRMAICVPCGWREQLVEFFGFARIEAGGRLVKAEQLRIGAHGARDLEPALGAIGEIARRIVGAIGQADAVEPEFARVRSPRARPACSRAPNMPATV